jgi:hypothetical protein
VVEAGKPQSNSPIGRFTNDLVLWNSSSSTMTSQRIRTQLVRLLWLGTQPCRDARKRERALR